MYARLSSVMFPIFTLMFVGAIVWGYQEHQEKNSVLIKAENQYQRAFHDLSTHMGRLHDQIGETLAVSSVSHGMQRKGLVNVWRLTSQAQNEINQLPLAMLPFNKAEQFLSRISNFAYRTAVRDLTKQPLTTEEVKMMKSLYKASDDVNRELGKVQDAVLKDRLRWMDVEVAMASENGPRDNTIIDGFKAMDKQMGAYPETDWGPSAMSSDRKLSTSGLDGKQMTPEEIRRKALEFLGAQARGGEVSVSEDGSKTDMPAYTVSVQGSGGATIQLDYTRKGGHLLWFMNPREVKSRKINFDTARNKGSQFLVRHGYPDMTPISYDEYDHVSVFTYARTIDGVKIYPDKVTVRVALDNGEIVGLQARDHVFAKKLLTPGKPKLTKEQAQKGLNPDFRVENHSLSLIENDMRELTLCHEFVGRVNDHRYRIYLNAETGLEENIEQLTDAEKSLFK
ncbi:germination protein YpeB [Cohnella sp. LGH]|uniref:Spore germination protein n=1 Tax=Cohnella phaseoli TaxID=456490 RepID=A0A3D9I242_9BACL|nr:MULTISPECIES: germination protein YpeB [Cohnella]QTH44825.1 germination protein YpeB [Cohnella sp. LGH]RED55226.1 spore germination protein [Cohnella phaseoli]